MFNNWYAASFVYNPLFSLHMAVQFLIFNVYVFFIFTDDTCSSVRTVEPLPAIYDMQFSTDNHFLYYSSWGSRETIYLNQGDYPFLDRLHDLEKGRLDGGSVSALHMDTGRVVEILGELIRPTGFYIKHSPDYAGNYDVHMPIVSFVLFYYMHIYIYLVM